MSRPDEPGAFSSRWLPLALLIGAGVALYALPDATPAHDAGDLAAASPEAGPGTLVVDYVDGTSLADIEAVEAAAGVHLDWSSEVSEDEALRAGEVPDLPAAIAALRADPRVEVAEPAFEMTIEDLPAVRPTLGFPNDPLLGRQWNLALVGAPAGWRVGGGAGVLVAVIDTGVSPLPDLPADRVLPGRSFVPLVRTAADDHGHGTHVAGTIAQATHNGIGVAGMAPNARILPLKVLTSFGAGRTDWIAAAIDEAVDQGAQVINLSLGGGHSDVLVNAVEKARKAGVIVVAAAGNAGREGLGSPADAPAAMAVTAVGPDDAIAPYSSWGKGVEIAGPGGNTKTTGGGITQATIDKANPGEMTFAEWQGTSMATPHVAGAAAVLLGAGAGSADEVESLLFATADDRDDPLHYGAGRVDVAAAVRKLLLVHRGILFGVGAVVSLAFAMLGTLPGRARTVAVVTGGTVAGGLFLLPFLPLPPSRALELLAQPLLTWVGPFWSGFPGVQSCVLPLVVGVLLGPSRVLGPLVLGLVGGVAGFLLYGAATGATDLWWMPLGFDRTWLMVNGTLTLVVGMAVAGMQKMRRLGAK
jgi:serine protease